ncbi:hypothetical protein [Bosea sp. (in: a-proteobacteria)]|uniref:beta strand repeat-containing protein n=1 Tax=Bosea sp. (in: a-proteobacteria) TaxID=1871050 RepID=UPI0025C237CF|nr:hypothetical protein [Bosea sp. (in: a-proteobacteria)]
MTRPVGSVSFIGYSTDSANGVLIRVLEPVLAGDVVTITPDGASDTGEQAGWTWVADRDLEAGTTLTVENLSSGEAPSDPADVETTGSIGGRRVALGSSTSPDQFDHITANTFVMPMIANPAITSSSRDSTSVSSVDAGGGASPSASARGLFASQRFSSTGGTTGEQTALVVPASSEETLTSGPEENTPDAAANPTFTEGNDSLTNDTLLLAGVAMLGGNDTLTNSGTIIGTDGVAIDMGAGNDTVTLLEGSQTFGEIRLGSGDDRLTATDVEQDLSVDAGDGNDIVVSGAGDDLVRGGEGDDELDGGDGDDALQGGNGNDRLIGGLGDDFLLGGAGNDTLIGGAGNDLLDGGDGIDTADYTSDTDGVTVDLGTGQGRGDGIGRDTLTGVENVIGGSGDDVLTGNELANLLDGGAGKDRIVAGAGDTVRGGDGDDLIEIYTQTGAPAAVDGGAGDDTLKLLGGGTGTLAASTVLNVEHLQVAGGAWTVGDTKSYADIVVKSGAAVTDVIYQKSGQTLVVEAGGAVGNDGLGRHLQASGGTIDNAGLIDGVSYVGGSQAGTFSVVNQSTGVITNLLTVVGKLEQSAAAVVNHGRIYGSTQGTIAIDFEAATGTGARIVNETGGVIATASHQDVIRGGQGTVIENSGTIRSDADWVTADGEVIGGGDAIDFKKKTGGSVHNYDGGLIEGSHHAITGKKGLTVVNDAGGTLVGRNGSAVNIDNDAAVASTVFVTNRGVMEGRSAGYEDSDGDAIDTDGLARIENWGSIKGLGANGYHNGNEATDANISEAIAIGGGTIINHAGATIYGHGRAIEVDDSSNGAAFASTFITNDGTIEGGGNGPTGVLEEHAAIMQAKIDGAEAINIVGSHADTITNSATGKIIGGIFTDGGDDTLSNDGSITALNGAAVDLGDDNDLFVNRAIVTGAVLLGAGNDELINQSAGVITGDVSFGDGNDKLGNTGKITGTVDMGAGDDFVNLYVGSKAEGQILLGDGNDLLIANDWISTDMAIDGGAGNDEIYTSFGNDTVSGGDGNDRIYANSGNDTVNGGAGDDEIYGQAGNDVIDGGDGADLINGGDGDDVLKGGLGDDVFKAGPGHDVIDGGEGYDTLDLSAASGTLFIDMASGRIAGAGIGVQSFTNIENLLFGAGGDTVTGGNGDDSFDGGDGDDTLNGGAGDDTLLGSAGVDMLNGGSGDDRLDGGIGDDALSGGSGDDILLGGLGNDALKGGSGDDWIEGGAGDDLLTGGSGTDTFHFAAGFGRDVITDFGASDDDVISFDGLFTDFASAMTSAAQVGDDVVFTVDDHTSLTLAHTSLASLGADDFRFA